MISISGSGNCAAARGAALLLPALLLAGGCNVKAAPQADLSRPAPTASSAAASLDPVRAVATASRTVVVNLHDVATAMTRPNGLPADTFPIEATHLQATLTSLAHQVLQSADPTETALRSVLQTYAALAGRLSQRGVSAAALGPELRATDKLWRAALTTLGAQAHTDLLAGLPPLLIPSLVPAPPQAP